ncbi:MAG: alpha/beta fold hydrolase [Vulcanimicrobiaceae bacterium]
MQLDIDGTCFDVLDEGRGPALVLLHGFPLAKETWDAPARALAEVTRVIRFDLRGLGSTAPTPGPYLMEQLASDVAEVLDALEVERAVVAGHSLGGYVTFAFYRMFAERCRGLGLICSRASADDEAAVQGRSALADRAEAEGIDPVVESFIPRYFAPQVYRERPDLVERATAVVRKTDPKGAAAMLRGMAMRVSSEDLFEEIDIPVRIVAGAKDTLVPLERAQEMHRGIRGAQLDVLDCGHFPLYEAPEAVTSSLERLIAAANGA